MKGISPSLGLRYKTNQGLKRGLLIHVPQMFQRKIKGGELPLSLKKQIRVVLVLKEQVVASVVIDYYLCQLNVNKWDYPTLDLE